MDATEVISTFERVCKGRGDGRWLIWIPTTPSNSWMPVAVDRAPTTGVQGPKSIMKRGNKGTLGTSVAQVRSERRLGD
jgi:hypothetical protein